MTTSHTLPSRTPRSKSEMDLRQCCVGQQVLGERGKKSGIGTQEGNNKHRVGRLHRREALEVTMKSMVTEIGETGMRRRPLTSQGLEFTSQAKMQISERENPTHL